MSYRTTPHTVTKSTPAELFMGSRLRTSMDILRPDFAQSMKKYVNTTDRSMDIVRHMVVGDEVLMRTYINRNIVKWVQETILCKLGPLTYKVQVGDCTWKRYIGQLCHAASRLNLNGQC